MTAVAIADQLRDAPQVVITAHLNPDGDALGAVLALRLALLAMGKEVRVILPSTPPPLYHFLPGIDQCEVLSDIASARSQAPVNLLLACDCGDIDRLGAVVELPHRHLLNCDHHSSNDSFGDVAWVGTEFACTCQMIELLLAALDQPLTPDIATCLYTGLVFDTGRFMHSNTGPAEFMFAARLVACGIDSAALNRRLTYCRNRDDLAAQGLAADRLEVVAEGRIAGIAFDHADLTSLPMVQDWGELVELPRSLIGVDIAYIMRQQENGDIRCSLRANPPYAVAPVAARFGGGGHPQAAGCTLTDMTSLAAGRAVLHQALATALDTSPTNPAAND